MNAITQLQTVLMGVGSCSEIERYFSSKGTSRIMLVCGNSFQKLEISKCILEMPFKTILFKEFSPNPKYEDIAAGVKRFRDNQCDGILVVGGGSAIDVAKCIKLFATMDDGKPYYAQEYRENDIPLLCVPTTAGTGSESTRFAVIYVDGEKVSISHHSLIPGIAILEPDVLKTLPIYQKKCSMLDALCQALESWWSVNSTDESIMYAKKAVHNFRKHMDGYLANTPEGNLGMLVASNYAGRAINITQTTAPHAMSYKMTSIFGLPHGHAVALSFPHVWQYMAGHPELTTDTRGADHVSKVLSEMAQALGFSQISDAIQWFHALLEQLDMKPFLNATRETWDALVDSVNRERLKNSPVLLDSEAIREMYQLVLT